MRCPQCQFENEEGSKFCGNCGATLVTSTTLPLGQIYCPRCGDPNVQGDVFCGNCGARLTPQASQQPHVSSESQVTTKKKTSAAWWLLPIFFIWVGGLIAWVVVRENDKGKARRLLFLGIAMTVFWFVFLILANAAAFFHIF